jgi:biotin carboxyl carrier protein
MPFATNLTEFNQKKMNKFKFTIRGTEYDVEILKIEENIATLEVNGTPYDVELHMEKKQSKTPTLVRKVLPEEPQEIAKKEAGSTTPVTAPLPGTIMELKVKKGDIVKKDQLLLIMEAMKMENNVLSEKEGVVESIKVQPGDSVLQGDVLIELV